MRTDIPDKSCDDFQEGRLRFPGLSEARLADSDIVSDMIELPRLGLNLPFISIFLFQADLILVMTRYKTVMIARGMYTRLYTPNWSGRKQGRSA